MTTSSGRPRLRRPPAKSAVPHSADASSADTLTELAPLIAPKVKRRLVLAGVLVPQAKDVTAAFVAQGLKPAGEKSIGEWIRIELER